MRRHLAGVSVAERGDAGTLMRVLVFLGGCAFTALAITGILNSALFTSPSTTKYLVTVVAGVFVTLLATVRDPLKLLVGIAVVVAPVDFVTTTANTPITPLLAVDLLAVLVCIVRSPVRRPAAVKVGALAFGLLVVPAIVQSDAAGTWALWLALLLVNGWLAFVVGAAPGGAAYLAGMMTLSALLQAAIAIWEFRTHHQLNLYQSSNSVTTGGRYFFNYGALVRPTGTLSDPIGLGQTLALYLPMMIALAASLRRARWVIATLLVLAVTALGLLLSLSRLSIVGGAVGTVIALALLPRGAQQARTAVAVVAILVGVVTIGLGLGGSQLSKRVASILHPTASHLSTAAGDTARQHIWDAALRTGEAHLATGVGFGNITRELPKFGVVIPPAGQAQNTYLQFFAEGGLPGLLALLIVIGAASRDLIRSAATQRLWVAGVTGSLVATLLTWTTDVEVRYAQVGATVAILIGLAGALSVAHRAQEADARAVTA